MMFVTKVVITFDVYLNFGLDVTILSGVCFDNLQERKNTSVSQTWYITVGDRSYFTY